MREHISNWLTEKTKVAGILACGIRSPDRKTFTRTHSPQFTQIALENACNCVTDTFQILQSNHFPSELVRWVFENYFVYGFTRPDGYCLALLTRRNVTEVQPAELETIVAEFQSLPA
jgi:hypothetical protein